MNLTWTILRSCTICAGVRKMLTANIKYPLCLKALHSKKYEYVVQEIWVRAILHNFCAEITSNVKIEEYGRKYEYQADYSEAVKTCSDFLRIHDEKSTIDVEGLIASNIEAVRP